MNFSSIIFLAQDFSKLNMGQRMLKGLEVTGVGILTVFAILFILILGIKLMDVIDDKLGPKMSVWFKKVFKSKKNDKPEINQENAKNLVTSQNLDVDDKKIVAVATAAVLEILENENDGRQPNIKFRVRSIKKI